jgi:cytochrome c556
MLRLAANCKSPTRIRRSRHDPLERRMRVGPEFRTVPKSANLCNHRGRADTREDPHMSPCSRNLAVATALVIMATGSTAAWAADEPANVVKYRQTFMKGNSAHLGMIAAIVKGEVSLTDELAANAAALADMGEMLSANLQQLFPEGTAKGAAAGVESRALPAIWEKWGEFEQVAMRFQEETAKLAEVAQGGDMAAIGQQVGVLGKEGCGACHETFREKQN